MVALACVEEAGRFCGLKESKAEPFMSVRVGAHISHIHDEPTRTVFRLATAGVGLPQRLCHVAAPFSMVERCEEEGRRRRRRKKKKEEEEVRKFLSATV
jgi:hypothetical protein